MNQPQNTSGYRDELAVTSEIARCGSRAMVTCNLARVFSTLRPPKFAFALSICMAKQFVPGARVESLCKSVFGNKEAKRVHGAAWKTAAVHGVILPAS